MKPLETIEFDDLIGCFIDYGDGKVGVISALAVKNNHIAGVMVQEEEDNSLQSEICPKCKYIESLNNSLGLEVTEATTENQIPGQGYTEPDQKEKPVTEDKPQQQIFIQRPLNLIMHVNYTGITSYQIMNPSLSEEEAVKVAKYFQAFTQAMTS